MGSRGRPASFLPRVASFPPQSVAPHSFPSSSKSVLKENSPFFVSNSRSSSSKLSATGLEGLNAAIRARENCPPQICLENLMINTIRDMNIDPLIVKYGHPAMMFVMLASMGGYGVYLGYQIRQNRLAKKALVSGTDGNTVDLDEIDDDSDNKSIIMNVKKMHPLLMGGLTIFSFLGAQGGVVSELVQGKPLTNSTHFVSAGVLLTFLLIQFASSQSMSKENVRNIHAIFGTGVSLLILAHAVFGFQLAFSL